MRRPLRSFALVAVLATLACDRTPPASADSANTGVPASAAASVRPPRRTDRPPLPPLRVSSGLLQPDTAQLRAAAPDSFTVVFETSQGEIHVAVYRAWAPRGVDRLYYLVNAGFFDAMRFYKVQRDFIAQFGYSGDTRVTAVWDTMRLTDDTPTQPNVAGTLAFASNGTDTRTTQLFFNLRDNTGLEQQGIAVIGRVVRGMELLPNLYDVHGQGLGVDRIRNEGNGYLDGFPNLDYILRASVRK